ncbi:DEAD-domain-containing protein [Fomitopsis serialis]|uniref:DEAD-domain-containing protein n=1 Tax=Fomitopsis serialis TaxID=139415 RepID=UPI0020086B77|nr:DEAD-domain-containing protein [Neoantrodia serialis]KAH9931522.1 DEAD-domain-containing protein [Neoantrodia serialis]
MGEAGPSRAAKPAKPKSKKGTKPKNGLHSSKSRKVSEAKTIEALEQAASQFEPPPGLKAFADLPISDFTKRGLKKAYFTKMTDIQAKSLPVSLKGKDVLGAARTGSGKTLAFLIPVLEMLYRRKWGPQDGLGALIISPTRELAVQIFDVLRSIGGYHSFSAGLVIGGKNLKDERERLSRMNILVATPGRLLQHMDQTIGFECDNLQILVLDEADRILDMGFHRTLTALLFHLPKTRQTLLFSATQTDSVVSLARLSLTDPVSIGVAESSSSLATPASLQQNYVVTTLDQKLSLLWSFLKSHLQAKTLVFLSSCKQVRFVFETFRRLHPGVPLLHLHGKQKQTIRLETFQRFTGMQKAVLLATDIAARGLDFPSVDWVVQVDAPEDAETYVHRVGRTARYESSGRALLFLMPSEEEGMKAALEKKGLQVEKIKIRASKTQNIENQLQNLAFQDPEIKYLGQRTFVSYLRSVHLQKDKSVFKVDELPVERFAESLGLPGMPKIKFLSRELAKKKKNASAGKRGRGERGLQEWLGLRNESSGASSDDEEQQPGKDKEKEKASRVRTKYDRMFERKNQNILSEHYTKLVEHATGSDEEDDFITLKRADHELPADPSAMPESEYTSKRKQRMALSKKAVVKSGPQGNKLVFDDEGGAHEIYEMKAPEEVFGEGGAAVKEAGRVFVEGERGRMKEADVKDKEEAREKKRERKRKRKEREREGMGDSGPMAATQDPLGEDDGYVSPEFDLPSEDEDEDEAPPAKRNRPSGGQGRKHSSDGATLEEEEELALQFLRSRR